jgi:hypothetical protein
MASELFKIVDAWRREQLTGAEWKKSEPPFYTLYFPYGIQNQAFKVYLELDEASDFIGIYVYMPISAPVPECEAVAELMMKINRRLRFGSLQIGHQDGEMRYYHGIDVEGGHLSPAMLDNMLVAAGNTLDDFFPLIMRAIYGQEGAENLVQEFEEGMVMH